MITIKVVAIAFGIGAAAILLLQEMGPDSILAVVSCFT